MYAMIPFVGGTNIHIYGDPQFSIKEFDKFVHSGPIHKLDFSGI